MQATTSFSRSEVERIVREVLQKRLAGTLPGSSPVQTAHVNGHPAGRSPLVVNISARHVHLSPEHVEVLFGYRDLKPMNIMVETRGAEGSAE